MKDILGRRPIIALRSSISLMPDSFQRPRQFPYQSLIVPVAIANSPAVRRQVYDYDSTFNRYLSLRWRCHLEPFSFDDNFERQRRAQVDVHYVKSRTEKRALRDTRKRAAIYQRAVYLHAGPPGDDAEGRRASLSSLSFAG